MNDRDLDQEQWKHLHGVALKRARSLMRGDEEAQDIAQSAMLGLLKAEPWPDNPEAWLMVTVSRRCFDLRDARSELHKAIQPEVLFNGEGNQDEALADEAIARKAIKPFLHTSYQVVIKDFLERALKVLTKREAQLLVESANGMTHEELAKAYGYASAATVSQTISRARKKLTAIQDEQHQANNIY